MFRFLLGLGFFVAVFIYISLYNFQPITFRLYKDLSYQIPLSVLVIISFVLGFLIAYFFSLGKDIAIATLKKKASQQDKIKEKLAETLVCEKEIGSFGAQKLLTEKKTGKDPFLLCAYGRFLRGNGELEKAKELHAIVKRENSTSWFLYEFLCDLFQEERFHEILAIVKDLKDSEVSPLVARIALKAAKNVGDYELALGFADKFSNYLNKEDAKALVLGLQAEKYLSEKNVKGLRKILKKEATFIPAILALMELGEGSYLLGILKEAFKKTRDITYMLLLIDLIVKREGVDISKTINFIKEIGVDDEKVRLVLAYLYAEVGMFDEASRALSEAGVDGVFADYVRFMVARGKGELENCCELAGSILKKSIFVYKCENCGREYSNLLSFCDACETYGSIKVKVD